MRPVNLIVAATADSQELPEGNFLTQLSLQNFRAFKKRAVVNLAIPRNIKGSGLTVLIGENNSGKSSIIESFKWMHPYRPARKDQKHDRKYSRIRARISDRLYDEREAIFQTIEWQISRNALIRRKVIDGPEEISFFFCSIHASIIPANRNWTANLGISPKTYDPDAFDGFTNRYFKSDYDTDFEKLFKENFGSIVVSINRNTDTKEAVNSLVRRVIPFGDWDVEVKDGEYHLVYIENNRRHSFDLLGSGVMSVFRICLSLVAYQGFVLAIDEPETNLSPAAQKRLLEVLADEAKQTQVIIATHSPYFIDWQYILGGAELVRISKGADSFAQVGQLSTQSRNEVRKILGNIQQPQLLDLVAKEGLFLGNLLVVEGQEDRAYIQQYFASRKLPVPLDIFGYGAGGADSITSILQIVKDLKIKAAVLFDGDKKGKEVKQKIQSKFGTAFLCKTLNADDIRDKYYEGKCDACKNRFRSKEGIFLKDGTIKSNKEKAFKMIVADIDKYLHN